MIKTDLTCHLTITLMSGHMRFVFHIIIILFYFIHVWLLCVTPWCFFFMLSLVTMERSQSYKGRPRASDGRSLATSSEMGVKKCFCEEPMLFSLAVI